MVRRKFHKNRFNSVNYGNISRLAIVNEKRLIKNNYDFLNCRIVKNKLICTGVVKPTKQSIIYKFVIAYDGLSSPKVNILEPDIEYNHDYK